MAVTVLWVAKSIRAHHQLLQDLLSCSPKRVGTACVGSGYNNSPVFCKSHAAHWGSGSAGCRGGGASRASPFSLPGLGPSVAWCHLPQVGLQGDGRSPYPATTSSFPHYEIHLSSPLEFNQLSLSYIEFLSPPLEIPPLWPLCANARCKGWYKMQDPLTSFC